MNKPDAPVMTLDVDGYDLRVREGDCIWSNDSNAIATMYRMIYAAAVCRSVLAVEGASAAGFTIAVTCRSGIKKDGHCLWTL